MQNLLQNKDFNNEKTFKNSVDLVYIDPPFVANFIFTPKTSCLKTKIRQIDSLKK